MSRLEDRTVPSTITWDGGPTGMGTQWLEAVNWVGDVLPGPNDDAMIAAAGAGQPTTLILGGSTSVRSANAGRTLQLTSGSLMIGAATSTFIDLVLAGGTLNPLDGAGITNSTIDGPGTFNNPSGVTLTISSTTIKTSIVNQAGATLSGSFYSTSSLTNAAGATVNAGSIQIAFGNLYNAGTVNIDGTLMVGRHEDIPFPRNVYGILQTSAGGIINVRGTLGNTLWGDMDNAGTINLVRGAEWRTGTGGTNSGTINVTGGNLTLYIPESHDVGPGFRNMGTVNIAAGRAFTDTGALLNLATIGGVETLSGGTFNIGGTFTFAGRFNGLYYELVRIQKLDSNLTLDGPGSAIVDYRGITSNPIQLNEISSNGVLELKNGRNLSAYGLASNTTFRNYGVIDIGSGCTLSTGTVTYFENRETGLLSGAGTIAGTVWAYGRVSPGSSPGILTIAGDFFDIAASLMCELNGTVAGADFDQLKVNGLVDLRFTGNSINVVVGFRTEVGDTFVIIDNDGADPIRGTLVGLPEGALIAGGETVFRISYVGGTGNDLTMTAVRGAIWDGGPDGTGTQWLDPVNWVGDVLPGPNNDVLIGAAGSGQPTTIVLDGSASVHSVSVQRRDLHLTSGFLTIGPGASFFWRLALSGGLLSPLSGATIGRSVIEGPGPVTVPNGITLNLSEANIQTDVINNGTVNVVPVPGEVFGTVIGQLTNAMGAVLRVRSYVSTHGVNDGAIEIVAPSGDLSASQADGLINSPTGVIVTISGGAGSAGVNGRLQNQGRFVIGTNTRMLFSSAGSINSGIIEVSGGDLTLSQSQPGYFANVGSIVVDNGRRLTVDSTPLANEIGGGLTVNGTFAGGIVNNGTLRGIGIITGAVSGNGIVSPGSSPGLLTVTGSFAGTGPLAIELNGPDVGTQYDQLKVNGSVTLAGPLAATLGFAPSPGQAFQIVENDGSDPIAGTFAGLPDGTEFAISGTTFRISYFGGTGNDVTLTRVDFGPHVSQVVVGDGTAQRSMVTQLKVVFDHIITYGSSPNKAYKLQKIVGGQPVGNVDLIIDTVAAGDHSEATLTFASDTTFGSLNDGRYRLNVIGEHILYNGVPMTQNYVVNFHRLFGDATGDGRVDIADYGLLSTSYNKQLGDQGYLAYFDYNNDGRVDTADYGQFALRYLARLP